MKLLAVFAFLVVILATIRSVRQSLALDSFPPLGSLQDCPAELPVETTKCAPVGVTDRKCVSECSEPVKIIGDLSVGPSSLANCLRTGFCQANISISGGQVGQPYTRHLADYFEALAPKLLDPAVQDSLKCDFLKYVKAKVDGKLNTKYADFKIQGIPVGQISCDPSQQIWSFVPLFPDDNSLGEIQFVNPKVGSIQGIKVSIPDVQRLSAATEVLQKSLSPATAPEPTTFGQPVTPYNSSDNTCTKTQNLSDLYPGNDYDRGVTCNLNPLPGQPDSTICVLSPAGQLQCGQQQPAGSGNVSGISSETVQVRTVFPYFYDIADQTISKDRGWLRIFEPKELGATREEFEKNFSPVPASIGDVHYQLSNSSGLAIDNSGHQQSGWQIYFYQLGGVKTARDFILKLLNPGR